MAKKNIVVLGAGFGGLRAALDIEKGLKKHGLGQVYDLILIDKRPYHTFTPLLYRLAAAKDTDRMERIVSHPIAEILKDKAVSFIEEKTERADLAKGEIYFEHGEVLKCDYLLLAPGSETNYFGIPGVAENSLSLKTVDDAKKISGALANLQSNARVLVGGGGPTGIELAAEIKANYPGFEVVIVEATPTLLPGFDLRLVAAAASQLRRAGVEVVANEPVAKAEPRQATTKSGKVIPFDLFVWTGGVKVSSLVTGTPFRTEARGRLETSLSMECVAAEGAAGDLALAPKVYALGDVVCVHDKSGRPVPGVARAAIQEGKVAARNILEDVRAAEGLTPKPAHKMYHPMRYPYVLPIGSDYAIGTIGDLIIRDLPAKLFKQAIELNYFISIMPADKAWRLIRG